MSGHSEIVDGGKDVLDWVGESISYEVSNSVCRSLAVSGLRSSVVDRRRLYSARLTRDFNGRSRDIVGSSSSNALSSITSDGSGSSAGEGIGGSLVVTLVRLSTGVQVNALSLSAADSAFFSSANETTFFFFIGAVSSKTSRSFSTGDSFDLPVFLTKSP